MLNTPSPLIERMTLFWHNHSTSGQDKGTVSTADAVLGQTGAFDGEQLLDMLLARLETAMFVTMKLWCELISDMADPERIEPFAAQIRALGQNPFYPPSSRISTTRKTKSLKRPTVCSRCKGSRS